jgi:hypothetical protein
VLAMFLKTRRIHLLLLWLLTAFNVVITYSKGAWVKRGFFYGCTNYPRCTFITKELPGEKE